MHVFCTFIVSIEEENNTEANTATIHYPKIAACVKTLFYCSHWRIQREFADDVDHLNLNCNSREKCYLDLYYVPRTCDEVHLVRRQLNGTQRSSYSRWEMETDFSPRTPGTVKCSRALSHRERHWETREPAVLFVDTPGCKAGAVITSLEHVDIHVDRRCKHTSSHRQANTQTHVWRSMNQTPPQNMQM